jgi:hypothetical protein
MTKTPEERKARLEAVMKNVRDNAEIYKRLFSGPDGQAVLKDLAKRCYVDRTTYEPEINKMAFNEGRRSIFVHINNLVNKDTEVILDELKGDQ